LAKETIMKTDLPAGLDDIEALAGITAIRNTINP